MATRSTNTGRIADILRKNRKDKLGELELNQIGVIQRNGRHLSLLIDDLLDLGRIERGDLSLIKSEFDATELLTEMEAGFQPIIETKRQSLILKMPKSPVWISADRDRLAQVISNLISNASKYSPEDTQIMLTARRRRDRLYVDDSGSRHRHTRA